MKEHVKSQTFLGKLGRAGAQATIPEVHSLRGQDPQGPDSSSLPYPPQTGVMALGVLNSRD